MRRLLGLLTCGGLLAGCGGSPDHTPASRIDDVRLVSQTAGGGRTSARATPLPDDAAVERYLAGFHRPLADLVRAAIADTGGPDTRLFAQVVSVGCDVPPGATARVDEEVAVSPEPVASPKRECFAPVTTVALVRVPVAAPDGY